MYIRNTLNNQDVYATLGRQIHARLEVLGARERLLEAIELCCEGRPMAARDAIEDALAQIDDGGRTESEIIDSLQDYPPVFLIDLALHERRHAFIDKIAQELGWSVEWTGETAAASADDGAFELHVNPVDGWRCTSGMPDVHVTGVGLTSLHAHIKGEDLAATVARLTPWYQRISKGGAA